MHESHQPHLMKDTAWRSWEWSAQWTVWKPTWQPHVIQIHWKQSAKVKTVVLKWVITKSWIPNIKIVMHAGRKA